MEFVFSSSVLLFKVILFYYSVALMYHWLYRKFVTSKIVKLSDKTLMVVLGSGGHTTEMLHMLDGLKVERYGHVYFIIGHSDTWSLTKLRASLPEKTLSRV